MIWTISYELYGRYNTDSQVRSGRPLKWIIIQHWHDRTIEEVLLS